MKTGTSNMSNDSTILINDIILHDLNDVCRQNRCEEIKVLKYNDDLVQLGEEEDDVENGTSTDRADDDNDECDDDDYDDVDDEERDLTSLTWLTELRNQTMGFVDMALDEETKRDNEFTHTVATKQMSSQQITHACQLSENEFTLKPNKNILGQKNHVPQHKSDVSRTAKITNQTKRPSPAERYEMFLNKIKRDLEIYEESAINYQSDIVEKPPFNYSHIIGMAMLENGRRVTLQQICSWIERKFAFFRVRKKWNNSIRHNLSLHPCFRKIGRNKEDKGKGGYWELGVDLKKCDRKRIRNRKSTAQAGKMQKKHFIKSTKRRQPNFTSIKKLNFKHCTGNVKHSTSGPEFEQLLLDEMDVQQNIDVMSTNTNHFNKHAEPHAAMQQQIQPTLKHNSQSIEGGEEVMLSVCVNNNENNIHLQQKDHFEEYNKNCSLADSDVCSGNVQRSEQTCQQLQYKLGTIIISSANVGTDMPPNNQNLNQRTINSFLTTNSTKQLQTEHQQQQCTNSICYSEVENGPHNDNVVISSYISELHDVLATCTQESNQCHNFISSSPSNAITLDISAFATQSIQQKPNVIVESVIQQPSLRYSSLKISPDSMPTSTSSPLSSSSATMCALEPQNGDYANGLVNEHFCPYIDGIDEAFQYLRSIDGTRNEDILDNLLDISVSDY